MGFFLKLDSGILINFSKAVKLLKPNGKLVYSTCTITIDENENQVAWALKTFKDLKLISQVSGEIFHKQRYWYVVILANYECNLICIKCHSLLSVKVIWMKGSSKHTT